MSTQPLKRVPKYVRDLGKVYNIENVTTLDVQLNEFVNLLQLAAEDGFIDIGAWYTFIRDAANKLFTPCECHKVL
jgi:hypothetical protein